MVLPSVILDVDYCAKFIVESIVKVRLVLIIFHISLHCLFLLHLVYKLLISLPNQEFIILQSILFQPFPSLHRQLTRTSI